MTMYWDERDQIKINTYTHTCACAHTDTHTCACARTNTHMCMHAHKHTHTCACAHTNTHRKLGRMHYLKYFPTVVLHILHTSSLTLSYPPNINAPSYSCSWIKPTQTWTQHTHGHSTHVDTGTISLKLYTFLTHSTSTNMVTLCTS